MNSSLLLPTSCASVILYVYDIPLNVVIILQIVVNIINVVIILMFTKKFLFAKMAIHVNFKMILLNGFIFFLIHSLCILVFNLFKQVQYRLYTDSTNPCDLHVLNWKCLIFRIFIYACLIGFCIIHVSACVERLFATYYISIYEKKGPMIGIAMIILIWATVIFCLVYIFTDWTDGGKDDLKQYCSVLSPNGSARFGHIHYVLIGLNIFATIVEFLLLKFNKSIKRKNLVSSKINYNLSKSYQVNENNEIMKAIMPVSLAHSLIFTMYLVLAVVMYYESNNFMDLAAQKTTTEGVYMINTFYIFIIVTMLWYNLSKNTNKPNVNIINKSLNQTDVYFKMFQSQIDTKNMKK